MTTTEKINEMAKEVRANGKNPHGWMLELMMEEAINEMERKKEAEKK